MAPFCGSVKRQLKALLNLLLIGLALAGFFLAYEMLLMLGIAVFVWLGKENGPAAWEIARSAWRLWLLGPGTLVCALLLSRYGRALEARAGLRRSDSGTGASANGEPATPVASSGVTGGPPSVSRALRPRRPAP